MDLTTLLFSFNGRINRGKYWLAVLIYVAAWIAFAGIALLVIGDLNKDDRFAFAGTGIALWLGGILLFLIGLWSGLAVGIKRLHDRDKSAWWLLLFWLGPSLLGGSGRTFVHGGGGLALSLLSAAISIWAFVEFGCLRGTPGPNAYGPDPLEPLEY
ncbi:uncharacterized membrane protein YhaH (DUF805 family) [Rhodopseudomonas rhenobacensis]|uniref:Uncharacterized membrane protein YhaH (DUF805 family) n=1 Tax=Rhodopseudomonas rhenobacensis TaxID=87461 RepID=A0A7W7Z857_9BRAD|nr:DUF805 domain-containing protein [Rhodopseudomonas rhenobacensis]MBB5049663.1 uncharacterized membrane protein YhaH (DUF805 family) [Rhodopseudomonas rhenobacensis]